MRRTSPTVAPPAARDRAGTRVLDVRSQVHQALTAGQPVVALETSVVAHGLPSPEGVAAARRCEDAVRRAGAVPATVGIVAGRVVVGCNLAELERLADAATHAAKAGERDLAPVAARGGYAGTTVSGTVAVAARCGIRVVATGGIGGVHRAPPGRWDVSADLASLARHPVAVVCAGAKAVLDLPRTVEALESLSILVLGYRTGEFPAFYLGGSGLPVEHRVDDADAAARILRLRFHDFAGGGALVVQPPPGGGLGEAAHKAVDAAVRKLRRSRVAGKEATPFLLEAVDRATGGAARKVNLDLLEANAALAGAIALAYARFRK